MPEFLAFLSGLPEAARRRRVLVPMQAYVDDSGGKGHGPHLFLMGLMAKSEDWAVFSEEWHECLERHPRIVYFKMSEAVGLADEFERWLPKDRDEKVRQLARIANRHVDVAIWSGINLQDHKETLAGYVPKDQPYFLAFCSTCVNVGFDLLDRGHKERFEIIFDEHVIFAPRVKVWYPVLREIQKPEVRAIMPVEPVFRSDREFLPLQAADMVAWCARRQVSGLPHPMRWVFSELSGIEISRHSGTWNKENMQALINQAEEARQRGIDPEVLERYWQLLGVK